MGLSVKNIEGFFTGNFVACACLGLELLACCTRADRPGVCYIKTCFSIVVLILTVSILKNRMLLILY